RAREVQGAREQLALFAAVRKKCVQRGIEQPERHRQSIHGLEDSLEVLALHRQELVARAAPTTFFAGANHLAHGCDAIALEEHVLCSTEADALGAEAPRLPR